jgi:ABC-type enterochelin transport system ATPase subunit
MSGSVTNGAARAITTALSNSKAASENDLSDLEKQTLNGLSGPDRQRAVAQLLLQKQQETVAFVSNVLKKLNDIAMSQIGNFR